MKAVVVCTSIYEAARPFLPAYLDGIRKLDRALGRPVDLVLANDGFHAAADAFSSTAGMVHIVEAHGSGIGRVRSRMIEAAATSNCGSIVFCDFDDALLAEAAGHLAILETADISFGDLRLIDSSGNLVAPSFFADANVPDRISGSEALVERNFLGFSNTAVRAESIAPTAMRIPDNQKAADWWFFSMLLEAGAEARRCPGAVAEYRLHGANTLGGRPAPDIAAALDRCRLFLVHQSSLPPRTDRAAAADRIEALAAAMSADPVGWAPVLKQACSQPGVWFDDLRAAATYLQPLDPSRNEELP